MITNYNSMDYWFPLLSGTGVPKPKTEKVLLSEDAVFYDEAFELIKQREYLIKESARKIGYPIFMRTDQASDKHGWDKTCYVTSEENLPNQLRELVESNYMNDLWISSIYIREFIPLFSTFKAFRGKFPVSRERRYFIRDGNIECKHNYWFEEVFERELEYNMPLPENWRELLAEINTTQVGEEELLSRYAKEIARNFDGWWSVDFAQSEKGEWYILDMAQGKHSFHYTDCQYCPKDIKRAYGKKVIDDDRKIMFKE